MKAPRARKIFDLHSVLGFYASWFLVISVVTGLVWSFKWFERGMYSLVGSEKNDQRFTSPVLPRDSTFGLNDIIIDVQQRNPDATELFVSLPDDSLGAIRVNALLPQEGFFRNENQLFYSQYTGHIVGAKSFSNLSRGDKLKASNFDIHTGRKFGLAGKLIMCFAALIAASLPVTGFLYWRARVNASKYLQNEK